MKKVLRMRFLACLPVLLALNTYAGVNDSDNPAGSANKVSFVYIGDGSKVSGYAFNPTLKTVTPIHCQGAECTGTQFSTGAETFFRAVALDPSGRFAYVTYLQGGIVALAIDATTGTLSRINCNGADCIGKNFPAGRVVGPVVFHPSGKYAYVVDEEDDAVIAYTLDGATGALRRIACSGPDCKKRNFTAGKGASTLTMHPSGNYLYVNNPGEDSISAYSINIVTGGLSRIRCGGGEGCKGDNFATGPNPEAVTIIPSGKFAYVANSDNDGAVMGFAIDTKSGALKRIDCHGAECTNGNFPSLSNPQRVIVNPTGKFAYTSNPAGSAISSYAINASSGVLEPLTCVGDTGCKDSNYKYSMVSVPVVIHPSGRFAYTTGHHNTIIAYVIDAKSGALTPIPCRSDKGCNGMNYQVGDTPDLMAVDPSGTFVYTANRSSHDLTVYTIDSSNGALTRVVCALGPDACNGVDFGGDPLTKREKAIKQAEEEGRYADAVRDLQWIAENNDSDTYSIRHLGYLYEIGLGVPRDEKKAIQLYKSAAGVNDHNDRMLLLYSPENVGSFTEWLEAFYRMKKFAPESGASSYALASMYLYGLGVNKDEVTAAYWMRRAAAKENPYARYLLGVMAAQGIGMNKNMDEAKELLESAAKLGSQEAASALKTTTPTLPKHYTENLKKESICATTNVRRQKGFPKAGQAEAFEDFRLRLRKDLADALTFRVNEQRAQPRHFANSVDGGVKGEAIITTALASWKSTRYVPPMVTLFELTFTTACPVGYGGKFIDELGNEVELWYVSLSPAKDYHETSIFKTPRLPPYGTTERNVFQTFLFSRDNTGRLMWYAVSKEQAALFNYWYNVQLH